MAKNKTSYICSNCGQVFSKWQGKCDSCGEWNTLEEKEVLKNNGNKNKIVKKAIRLKDVQNNDSDRIITNIDEFDRVVGGGLVNDSVTILASPPGMGKSTLSLMLCNQMIKKGLNVLYASGEESSSQIKNRAKRLDLKHTDDLWIIDNPNLDMVLETIKKEKIDFFIVDSIKTFYLNEFLPSRVGNPTQVAACSDAIVEICKRSDKPISSIIIGQMNKDDELAGSRSLEHLVDTYIEILGDNADNLRILQSNKNRFGNTGETGFFDMTEKGLESIKNPSEFFMTTRDKEVIGTSLTVLKEGSRPIIVEIESLVSTSYTPYPARICDSLKKDQLNTLISILEQRADINLNSKDVVIKTGGGIKLTETSSNLATLMSIASSSMKLSIDFNIAFIADVGLTGELKKVPNISARLKELDRLGYEKAYVAKNTVKTSKFKNLKIVECNTLKDVINDVF